MIAKAAGLRRGRVLLSEVKAQVDEYAAKLSVPHRDLSQLCRDGYGDGAAGSGIAGAAGALVDGG